MNNTVIFDKLWENEWYFDEINYEEMTNKEWDKTTTVAKGTFMWIKFKVIFYSMWHPCAYIKIPEQNNIEEMDYCKIHPCTCHWGFTFLDSREWLWEWLWLWWDYAHLWDSTHWWPWKKWTTHEIISEIFEQIEALYKAGVF